MSFEERMSYSIPRLPASSMQAFQCSFVYKEISGVSPDDYTVLVKYIRSPYKKYQLVNKWKYVDEVFKYLTMEQYGYWWDTMEQHGYWWENKGYVYV